jgi:Protein of unknown function (DUF3052)
VSAERDYSHRSRIDKLGVKTGMRVAAIGIEDAHFAGELAKVVPKLAGPRAGELDLVFLAADSLAQLDALVALAKRIKPAGAIWVVSRKGKAAAIRDVDVIAGASRAGLVDNKVVGFSETHTSLRLCIPVALRKR